MPVKHYLLVLALVLTLAISVACGPFHPAVVPSSSAGPLPLTVTFLDLGQADCTLVQEDEKTLLIDAGTNASAKKLVSALKQKGIKKIDILVGTHPHEDHIGGLDAVIKNFNIGAVYLPEVSYTTRTFNDVLTAISAKGLKISLSKPGDTFNLNKAVGTFLAPNSSSYEEINNYSLVVRLKYGNIAFLFSGDAQNLSEREMLAGGYELKSDVLKVSHHGSSDSTSSAFLLAVAPRYAVIFVGKDNDYNHPHEKTLEKLSALGVQIYRTDLRGDIIFDSDGIALNVRTQR